MSGAYPELIDKSTMYVNSLVDDKGEQITVGGTSSVYYANLIDNFGKDYFAGITINDKTTGKTLHQDTTIYRPGSGFPNVILTNESGSNSYPVPTYSTASILLRQQVNAFKTGSSAYFPSGSVVMYDTFGFVTGSVGGTIEPQVRKTTPGYWSFDTLYCSTVIGSLYYDSVLGNLPFTQDNSASLPFGGVGGYGTPVPFTYTPGLYSNLELRFNQDENLTYPILGIDYVYVPSLGNFRTILFLDRSISTNFLLSGSVSSSLSGVGNTVLTKTGGTHAFNSSFNVYFAGYSGSYHTRYTFAKTFPFDSTLNSSFNISSGQNLELYPSLPSEIDEYGYEMWIVNGFNAKRYYYNTRLSTYNLTTSGVTIPLTGPTNTNFDIDLVNAGFILDTNPLLTDTIPAYNDDAVGSSGFLIRQYSEDTSQILINGTRLIAGVPGYMKPQFMSPTLSASFDATIQELKKEGII